MKSSSGKVKGKNYYGSSFILLCLLISSFSSAQQTGIVEGRVVNETDPSIVAGGVPLEVVALSAGMSIIRSAPADSSGAFRFEGLPVDQMLMVRAIYKDVNYHTQVVFDPGGRANIEIKVFEETASMDGIGVEECQMVFQIEGSQLQILDTFQIHNVTLPEKTFMDPDGNFRFSKAPEILSHPQMRITAPGSSLPVIPSVLESPDGKYYYSLYPLRPGKTKVETFQVVPYASRKYTYVKKFYYRIPSIEIGVTPINVELSGAGLTKVRTDPDENVAVYRIGSIEAGTEVQWVLSGGTPAAVREEAQATQTEPGIRPSPNAVGRNALIIGPLILIGFILILWHAYNRSDENVPAKQDLEKREIRKRRNELLDHLADLDHRYEMHLLDKKEYLRQREKGKGMLRRIALLLKKN